MSRSFDQCSTGQVIGLFIVGISEYGVICFGTDWDEEVQKGITRNAEEAKQRALLEHRQRMGELTN